LLTKCSRVNSQGEEEDEGEGSSSRPGVKEFTGIGVEVRFAAGGKIGKMSELSGGQKVCSLLLFAHRHTVAHCKTTQYASYGVATMSRILKNTGLFAEYRSLL